MTTKPFPLADTVALVTGANRGLGKALVDDLLRRGTRKIYAATRSGAATHADPRVVAVELDLLEPDHARAVALAAPDVRLLLNNAGSLASMSVLAAEPAQLRRDLDVNFHGVAALTRAFVPQLRASAARGEPVAIVNVLSVAALASMPGIGGYSASKAAAWSLTQALRSELAANGVRVHAVFPGPIDTDMIRGFDLPKTSAGDVARALLDGVAAGTEDIAPDPMSIEALAAFARDPREIARRFGAS